MWQFQLSLCRTKKNSQVLSHFFYKDSGGGDKKKIYSFYHNDNHNMQIWAKDHMIPLNYLPQHSLFMSEHSEQSEYFKEDQPNTSWHCIPSKIGDILKKNQRHNVKNYENF